MAKQKVLKTTKSSEKKARSTHKNEKIVDLVTGGTSGLGVRLIEELLRAGHEVHAIIRDRPSADPEWKRLPPGVMPYVADLTLRTPNDEKVLQDAAKGVHNVYHLAGATYMTKYTFNQYVDTNVIGTENLLKACIDANPEGSRFHVIYPSTIAVYGNKRPGHVISEEAEPKPSRPYSESKLMAEQVIKSFAEVNSNLHYTILRVGTIYGPGYESPYFTKVFRYIHEQKMRYIGSGLNHLTLIHVDDVVRAMLLVAEKSMSTNKTYNLTDGEPYTVRQLFEMTARFMGVPPPKKSLHPMIAVMGARAFKISPDEMEFLTSDRVVTIDKIKNEINFKPEKKIEIDGLDMVRTFLERARP